jgi:ferrochelatase
MRYWRPRAEEVLLAMAREQVQSIVALPLYPQYFVATTGSSLHDLRRAAARLRLDIPIRAIRAWPDEPAYIGCLADRIMAGIRSFQGEPVQVAYSAHSLPTRFIREGDPYVEHLRQTIQAVEARTAIAGILCYQSRSGPVEWLGPALPEVIAALAREGCANLLVVPISFVSDHVETLFEIDIQYREMAEGLGMRFASTPGLNADPCFIAGLRNLILDALGDERKTMAS